MIAFTGLKKVGPRPDWYSFRGLIQHFRRASPPFHMRSFPPGSICPPVFLVFQHGGKREDPGDKVAISLFFFYWAWILALNKFITWSLTRAHSHKWPSLITNSFIYGFPRWSLTRAMTVSANKVKINRGYYTVARRYEFYFGVAKQYFTHSLRSFVKYCFFFTRKLNSYLQAAV